MSQKSWLLALGLTALLIPQAAQAAPVHSRTYTNSIRPFSSRVHVLGTAPSTETVEFQVALRMRDLVGLRTQIAAGESLSNAQMIADHFPLASDYQLVVDWLAAQGLTVERTHPNYLSIEVRGTVAQVSRALGTEFVRVKVDGKPFVAARTAPSLPTDFSRFVLGINGLQPYQRAFTLGRRVQPESPTVPYAVPYSINDIKTAYSGLNLGVDGTGQTIAILIDVAPQNSDLTTFWTNSGINQSLNNITTIQAANPRRKDRRSGEETLDTEMTSGVAAGAKVRIYLSGTLSFTNLDKGFQAIINDLPSQPSLRQLSISLGACEQDLSSSQLQTDSQYLATIAGYGVSTFLSSGDSGSNNNCTSGLGVGYYASDPSVTAVGGTALKLSSSGAVTSETVWNNSYGATGGGISSYFSRPSWQVGTGVPSGSTRLVPDVALDADVLTGVYVIYNGAVNQFGGTSVSAPLWAGFAALINQARANAGKGPLGLLNPKVYPLLGSSNFRDITSGNNGAYSATPGYDLTTGIGVPVFSNLLPTLVNQP